ncbi:uncharacterized protein LOC119373596 [Rhipicephalus sanguineus]|uniref:uncharacterized protein LOC119373596 n=1 Tax=Rhipicephalus sanguineus TaxID=34632 RepID=UPI00189489C4|nr:uncharacterized protein LOC119373596 [Rhipicephalus sanguineus]
MDAEDRLKPAEDADATKDDAEIGCASGEEGSAETSQHGGRAPPEDLGTSSSTSGAATTEAETEDSSKTSVSTAEAQDSGETSKDKSEAEDKNEAEMKDPAKTSQPKDKTAAEAKDSVKASKPTGETETGTEGSADTSQPTPESEDEMKESSETSQSTPEPEAETREVAEISQPEVETEAETKKSAKMPLQEAVADPSRARQVTESTSSSETPEQSSDESRMDVSSKPPRYSGPRAAAKRSSAMALGKRRRQQQPLTPDNDNVSSPSPSIPPAAKLPRSSVSSDSEEGLTPTERALAEARKLELERTVGGADVEIAEPPSSSGSASVSVSTPDVSSDTSSQQSMALDLPEEEQALTSRPETPSEGAGAASGSGEVAQRPRESDPLRRIGSPLSFAEAALRPSSCEDVVKPLTKWPASPCLSSSSTTTSSLSSFTDSEAGGAGGNLSRSASLQGTSTSQRTFPAGKKPLTRSETIAGPLTTCASAGGEGAPVSLTLQSAEMLSRTQPAGEETQEEKMEEDASSEPSREAGTSSLGASSSRGESAGPGGNVTSSGGGGPPGSPPGSGPGPQPMESDESESDQQIDDQPQAGPGDELVTSFVGPRAPRTVSAEEWDATKRTNGKASDTSTEDDQPGPSGG